MTSTNITHGVNEDGRSSSRILRPPGGGLTDILGLGVDPNPQPTKKVNQRNFSSILEGTNEVILPATSKFQPKEEPSAPAPEERAAPVPATTPVEKISTHVQSDTAPAPIPAPMQAAPPPASQRTRVPPGGFSSGLW